LCFSKKKFWFNYFIIGDLMEGLKVNSLDNFTHVLTGYVGDTSFLEQVHETIKHLKQKNPDTIYGDWSLRPLFSVNNLPMDN